MPVVTSQTYDNTQSKYNVSRILGDGFAFDVEKYKQYFALVHSLRPLPSTTACPSPLSRRR